MNEASVGVCGAGTMGAGIAVAFLEKGYAVSLYDPSPKALEGARAMAEKRFGSQVEKGRLTAEAKDAALGRLALADSPMGMGQPAVVIEAVVEKLEVKQGLFRQLAEACPRAILASNTSSLSIDAIAGACPEPGLVAGLHFFNPAFLMPLVEVVAGQATRPEMVDELVALCKAIGKTPVVAKDSPGFIVNRVARPFYSEAFYLADEFGVPIGALDGALKAHGFKLGPGELTDLIGQDVNYAVTTSVWEGLGKPPRFKPSQVQEKLVEEGSLGRKTGQGFYRY